MSGRARPRHRAIRRARRGPRRATTVVAPQWQRWVVENLLEGVDAADLVAGLVDGGVPEVQARDTVAHLMGSPALAVARQHYRKAQRLATVARLRTEVSAPLTLERRPAPSESELWSQYWATSTPAVFTDIVTQWRRHWTPASLRERFGEVQVEACIDRTQGTDPDPNWREHRAEMTLSEYIDRVLHEDAGNDLYLIANNRNTARPELRPLWDDVVLPAGWFDEPHLPFGSALWVGPAGTITPLHHDTSNILFCQIYGRKDIVLVPPWAPELLDSARGVYNTRGLDELARDGIESIAVRLEPGEALFIPAGWWHDVRAVDVSISMAINAFARPNTFPWYKPGSVR